MTLEALDAFGVVAAERREGLPAFRIRPSAYVSRSCRVEADWSQARLLVRGPGPGLPAGCGRAGPRLHPGGPADLPLLPPAPLAGPGGAGRVPVPPTWCPPWRPRPPSGRGRPPRIVNAARLRIKESDRLSAVTAALGGLGAQIEEGPDSLTIHGVSALRGGTAESFNDHRIAMMLAVAATRAEGPVTVRGGGVRGQVLPQLLGRTTRPWAGRSSAPTDL